MLDCLICVTHPEDGMYIEARGAAGGGRCLNVRNGQDFVSGDTLPENASVFTCNKKDLPHYINHVTNLFPGMDVHVYQMTQIASRPVGETKVRNVTEEGVLPF